MSPQAVAGIAQVAAVGCFVVSVARKEGPGRHPWWNATVAITFASLLALAL